MKSKKEMIGFIFVLIVIIIIVGLIVYFTLGINRKEQDEQLVSNEIDLNTINNVWFVDDKLDGEDYRITQSYLYAYVKNKSSIWYQSVGYVKNIVKKNEEVLITLQEEKDSNLEIVAIIDSSLANVKKGDYVYFVGKISLKNKELILSKISTEEIDYRDITAISLNNLIRNIDLIKNTYFIINGFMVTDNDKYKLYNSKDDYKNDGNYLTLNWKDEFLYTGNQEVKVRCLIRDTYVLGDCELL